VTSHDDPVCDLRRNRRPLAHSGGRRQIRKRGPEYVPDFWQRLDLGHHWCGWPYLHEVLAMTDEANRLADEIERRAPNALHRYLFAFSENQRDQIAAALRAIPQEPVAWRWHASGEVRWTLDFYPPSSSDIIKQPLYAAPYSRGQENGPSPSEPIAQGQREAIARIIDPGSFKYHRDMIEAGIADGMTPIAALEQAHRACRSTIPEALAKADAILATLSQEPVKLMEGMHYVTRGNKNNLRQFVGPLVASGDDEFPWRSGDHHWRADGTSAESKVRDIVSDPVYPPLATLPQPPVGACREALDLLQMQQRGRARALRILDASRAVSDPATLAQADAYEECGNELLAALAPSAQEGETVAVPKAALDWLNGEAPDADGKWFGESAPDPNGQPYRTYWWRSKFRSMIPALSRPDRSGGSS